MERKKLIGGMSINIQARSQHQRSQEGRSTYYYYYYFITTVAQP
jgi:hypothetical protein